MTLLAVRPVFENDSTDLVVEIHFGEGGADSKLFVFDLLAAYVQYAKRKGFAAEIMHDDLGHAIVQFSGKDVWKAFQHETGKHVVQRIPPTENNGRKQTSVVSVMVLPLRPEAEDLPESEFDITANKLAATAVDVKAQCGHGPGGQHQNKTASAIRMTHKATGLQVFINGRDQLSNKKEAFRILTARVKAFYQEKQDACYDAQRKEKWSGGGRGAKIRTYNFMESRVTDHNLGVKTSNVKAVMKGHFELLFEKV